MKKLKVLGTDIVVYKKKVKIYDPENVVSDDYAILLLEYLHEEGFINADVEIHCEIINE